MSYFNKEEYKKYYSKNKEKIKQKQKVYREKNRKEIRQKGLKYYEKNKEKAKEYYKTNKNEIVKKRKNYYYKNIEKIRQKNKEYRNKNKEKILFCQKQLRLKLREKIIKKYGGKCIKCNFSDSRVLQIDHINGGGQKEFRLLGSGKYYKNILKDTTGKYQLLCANCNSIKKYENNEI